MLHMTFEPTQKSLFTDKSKEDGINYDLEVILS